MHGSDRVSDLNIDCERPWVGRAKATASTRAKWRASTSACQSVLENYLTPPTLSERRFFNTYPAQEKSAAQEKRLDPCFPGLCLDVPAETVSCERWQLCGQSGYNLYLWRPPRQRPGARVPPPPARFSFRFQPVQDARRVRSPCIPSLATSL